MLDDKNFVVDSVPEGNFVRFIARAGFEVEKFSLPNEIDIVVKNLVRKFGDFTAVDKTNFEVRRAEVFGLIVLSEFHLRGSENKNAGDLTGGCKQRFFSHIVGVDSQGIFATYARKQLNFNRCGLANRF